MFWNCSNFEYTLCVQIITDYFRFKMSFISILYGEIPCMISIPTMIIFSVFVRNYLCTELKYIVHLPYDFFLPIKSNKFFFSAEPLCKTY